MPTDPDASDIGAVARSADLAEPLLIVAEGEVVGQLAPAWSDSCQHHNLSYRVLIIDSSCSWVIDDIRAEATAAAAGGILAIGAPPVLAAATAAAQELRLPMVAVATASQR